MNDKYKYIAKRFTDEHIHSIKKSKPLNLPKLMTPLKKLGIGARGVDHPEFWREDQFYNLKNDPKEMDSLIGHPEYTSMIKDMKKELTKVLQTMSRPYGEFVPGSDTSGPGQMDEKIALVEQLHVKGKKVTIPDSLKSKLKK